MGRDCRRQLLCASANAAGQRANAALRFRPETELVSAEQKAAFDRMQPELAAPVRDGQKKKAVVWVRMK